MYFLYQCSPTGIGTGGDNSEFRRNRKYCIKIVVRGILTTAVPARDNGGLGADGHCELWREANKSVCVK